MRYFFFILIYCSIYASSARVVTYNLLNFSDEDEREDDFITIIEYIQPDIIFPIDIPLPSSKFFLTLSLELGETTLASEG